MTEALRNRLAETLLLGVAVAFAAVDPERNAVLAWLQPLALGLSATGAAVLTIRRRGLPTTDRPSRWLVIWLAWAVLGAALSNAPGTSLFAVATFAAIGVAAAGLPHHSRADSVVAVLAVAAAASLLVAAFVELAGGHGGFSDRLQLLFLEPNQLARFAGIVLVSAAASTLHQLLAGMDDQRPRHRTGFELMATGVISILATAVLLATGSRTGVAAAAVGVILVIGSRLSRRLSATTIVVTGVCLSLAAVLVVSGTVGDSISQSLARDSSSATDELRTLNGRTVLWPEVIAVAASRSATGYGVGLDRAEIGRFQAEGAVVWNPEHAHSLPLHLWLTTGLPGLGFAAAAIVSASAATWRRPYSAERTLLMGTLGVLVVDGIVEPTLRIPSAAWVILVIACTQTVSTNGPAQPATPVVTARS